MSNVAAASATGSGTAFEVIVVGLGGIGSGAVCHLAQRGVRVLGLDMFPAGHDQGSSHGHHRMIRLSAQNPQVAQMSARAFELWRELEAQTDTSIMHLNGEVALIDKARFAMFSARGRAADPSGGGRRELWDEVQLRERFPGFRMQEGMVASYEATAGYLLPEVGMAAHITLAERHGAVIRRPEAVQGWNADGDGVRVVTDQGTYTADRLLLTAGPWSVEMLPGLNLPLQVVRIVNTYFEPERPDLWSVEQGAPDFSLAVPEGGFYGMPSIAGQGVKIGRHDDGEPTTARTIRREVDAHDVGQLRNALDRYMPGASGAVKQSITCMYTMTPDEVWIIERHPQHANVAYFCGCSGTGYKFSGVIGEMLANEAQDIPNPIDLSFVSSSRFATAGAEAAAD